MIYTANQSLFFPCIYMLNRFDHAGTIVLMGEAQYSKFGHHSRADIITKQGPQTLSVPLKDRAYKPLNSVLVADPQRWAKKFLNTLQAVYGKCDGYKELKDSLTTELLIIVERPNLTMFDLGVWSMSWCMRALKMKVPMVRAEDILGPRLPEWDASDWVARMGQAIGAEGYLGGGAAMKNYVRFTAFSRRGIWLKEQDFRIKHGYTDVRGQRQDDATVSILDALMTVGPDETGFVIGTGQASEYMKPVAPEDCHSM